MDWVNLLFGTEGRINRAKYWLAVLVYLLVWMVAGAIVHAAAPRSIAPLANSLVALAIVVSGAFVVIKRLHDRGKLGWWLIPLHIAPGILLFGGFMMALMAIPLKSADALVAGYLVSLAGLALFVWALVELACLRGTVGPNEYGSDPLA
jgi:uncharacterized membrane protein YhaH (DUF805 family)